MDSITVAALGLMRSGTPVPSSLAGRLAARLGRRVRSAIGVRPRVTLVAGEADVIPAAIGELAQRLDRELDDEERQLLAWLAAQVPADEVAEWVGSGFGGARVRVLRLRERLRAIARQHAATLAPDQRVELERYLSAPPLPAAMRTHASPTPPRSRSTPIHRPA